MTHVALVGARINSFRAFGFSSRSELVRCRIIPPGPEWPLSSLPRPRQQQVFREQFPLWVHNIIADPGFPRRALLAGPLRRFEGELRDSRGNEVVAAVLTAGFRDRDFNPLSLPDNMPLRQRCQLLTQLGVWQAAYRALERDLVDMLCDASDDIDEWLESPLLDGTGTARAAS